MLNSLRPLKDPLAVAGRFKELSQEYANPYPEGVQHHPIACDDDGAGIVATFIPAWDGVPVMAMSKVHRHYMRSGSSFRKMENYMLADRFGKRPPAEARGRLPTHAEWGKRRYPGDVG